MFDYSNYCSHDCVSVGSFVVPVAVLHSGPEISGVPVVLQVLDLSLGSISVGFVWMGLWSSLPRLCLPVTM